ncbi:radical SAM protein [Desulfovibrio sp. TomC]|uniref:radical SAM protein n=1 Tax=Desulfovibrio sp. TomC TaxID=1562888 RepID=UPI000574CA15|nr:radical SAM protein [Desulfovibrio sp. TomC]KHK00291.1 Radical SAM, Pyruvate-formate lyase-activating enzyme like [Desulfovibrio sp. TomC]
MPLLYTPFKIFHYKNKIDSLPQQSGAILPPVHIRLKPTNRCNHNCRYCAYRAQGLQLGQDMRIGDMIPRDKMAEILEDIISMGVQAVTFSGGGEPLSYPHIVESVRTLAQSSVRFAALTNGALLKDAVAALFAAHGTWLRVSMDGWDDESYTRYRGVPSGEYTRIMANMAAFKRLGGGCLLGVSLIVDEENHDRIFAQVRRLKDIGVDSVKISPCIVSNDGAVNKAYHKPFFDIAKEQSRQAKQDLSDAAFEVFDSYHELEDKFQKEYTWCPFLQMLCVIGADCNVYTCQDKAYNLDTGILGSLREERFKAFWSSEKSTFFKVNPARDCNHHCVANGKNKMLHDYLDASPQHLPFV